MQGIHWVIDTEGNGANPNEPIELGAIEMDGLNITGNAYVWRFKPYAPITYYANKIHGITNEDLASCPTFERLHDEIYGVIGDHPIIGHSVSVELNMLEPRMKNWSPTHAYDTLRIARRLLPDQKHHKLQILADQFELSKEAAAMTGRKPHNGLYDSLVTALLLQRLSKEFPDKFETIFKQSDTISSRKSKQERDERRRRNKELKRKHRQ